MSLFLVQRGQHAENRHPSEEQQPGSRQEESAGPRGIRTRGGAPGHNAARARFGRSAVVLGRLLLGTAHGAVSTYCSGKVIRNSCSNAVSKS